MTNILIVEDHLLVREGIKLLLKDQLDFKIVAEASTGKEVQNIIAHTEIDLVILNINIPELEGIETAEYIKEHYKNIHILILTMHNNDNLVNKSFQIGVLGYILKNTNKEEFVNAVKTVANGEPYISHKIIVDIIKRLQNPIIKKNKITVNLSSRELEILTLIAEGFTNGEIADKTFTSKRTIETHRKNLLEKTGAKNSASLIKFAMVNDLIKMD